MAKPKFKSGDRVIGNEKKASFWGRKGTIVSYEPRGQYWVRFDDGRTECADTGWIELVTAK